MIKEDIETFEFILEAGRSLSDRIKIADSHFIVLYSHIIKWYCEPSHQSSSWISSISTAIKNIKHLEAENERSKSYQGNKFALSYTAEKLYTLYSKGITEAKKEIKKEERKILIPPPDNWINYNNITNMNDIINFLYYYAESDDSKDLIRKFFNS